MARQESAEGRRCPDYENTIISYKTSTIEIQGGNIHAVGGDCWLMGSAVHLGGAGIGTGMYGIGGTVRILGGTVKSGRRKRYRSWNWRRRQWSRRFDPDWREKRRSTGG